jgi:hypothetical protein
MEPMFGVTLSKSRRIISRFQDNNLSVQDKLFKIKAHWN